MPRARQRSGKPLGEPQINLETLPAASGEPGRRSVLAGARRSTDHQCLDAVEHAPQAELKGPLRRRRRTVLSTRDASDASGGGKALRIQDLFQQWRVTLPPLPVGEP